MPESTRIIPASSAFDAIKELDTDGTDIWRARNLQTIMDYPRWADFLPVVERAMAAAKNTGHDVTDVFRESPENPSSQGGRPRKDYKLTRFAAYLVAMNGNPSKERVAEAQAYFATRTREAEASSQKPAGDDLDLLEGMIASMRADRRRLATLEAAQQATEAKLAALEGTYDWFTALGFAKLNGFPTNRTYLQRIGTRAGAILRARGEEPVKRQDATFGSVNTYPAEVLGQAFEEVSR